MTSLACLSRGRQNKLTASMAMRLAFLLHEKPLVILLVVSIFKVMALEVEKTVTDHLKHS